MPTEVLMPALSPTMEKGKLAKWLKKEGDTVKSGDIIAEIETDKATMEVEAVDEGTLGKILVPEGTADVAVNTPIAVILADGEDKSAISGRQNRAPHAEAAAAAPAEAESANPTQSPPPKSASAAAASAAKPKSRRRSRHSRRHRDGHHDHARSVARRHGGGDAPRRGRVPDGRGGRRVSGRLQGHAGPAAGVRRHGA